MLFILAVVIGLTAFGVGFYQLSNRVSGYYEVTATRDDSIPRYANGIRFYCRFNGKSSAIKSNLREAESVYTESLSRVYRLLNADEEYEGYVNLATLNRSVGKPVTLPVELYTALTDLLERAEQDGYDPYRTVSERMWENLRYGLQPETFDPSVNADTREAFDAVAAALNEPDAIRLEILDAKTYTVQLTVSDALQSVLRQYEVESPLLDFGVLREAYELKYVGGKLAQAGFTDGMFTTDSGVIWLLPDTDPAAYTLIGFADGKPVPAVDIPQQGGTAICAFRAFAAGDEAGYYRMGDLFRHPYLNADGEPNPALLTVCVLSHAGDPVAAASKARGIYTLSASEAKAVLASLPEDLSALLITADAPRSVVTDAALLSAVSVHAENGYAAAMP